MFLSATGWVVNTNKVRSDVRTSRTYRCVKRAGEWAHRNIPHGQLLFTTDWDDFPHLYLNAPKLAYVVGLDPVYMAQKDPVLYQQWRRLTQGRTNRTLTADLRELFGASWVFTDRQHNKFRKRLMREPGVREEFRGYGCWIFRLASVRR